MTISRRTLLKSSAGAALCHALTDNALPVAVAAGPSTARIRFGVSTYSYWHFDKVKYPVEKVIENAAQLGFEGVEILHRQMENETKPYLNKLKRMAWDNGLSLFFLSIHQNFVQADKAKRQEHIDHTKRCLDLAHYLGCPAIRLNSGRWGTIPDFQKMLDAGGKEQPLPGYTDDDAFNWCIESINQCLPHAEAAGVAMALENHWGLTTSVEGLLRIYKAVNSPWLVLNVDTGNFFGEPYSQLERLAPHASIVQAKTYYGGGVYYTLDPDFKRIAKILRGAGFKGWISLEMEGKEDAQIAVAKSLQVLRESFNG
ncbi:MAG: sugar phosphate isomerase/epimerase [Acidobacteria bacterium]|nr:sugar phosphate isomerase/epimerase [Acidobacteriota bacterium]MBI3426370.1 sugar phosphate isomerase/epimerase [Acidobacteriota bacterium]